MHHDLRIRWRVMCVLESGICQEYDMLVSTSRSLEFLQGGCFFLRNSHPLKAFGDNTQVLATDIHPTPHPHTFTHIQTITGVRRSTELNLGSLCLAVCCLQEQVSLCLSSIAATMTQGSKKLHLWVFPVAVYFFL